MITFMHPNLWILIFLPLIMQTILPAKKNNLGSALRIPFIKDLQAIEGTPTTKAQNKTKFFYIFIIWALLVICLMRPITKDEEIKIPSKSREIVMITDISPSMLEKDFVYNAKVQDRLSGVKAIASKFIASRSSDKVGLVLFASKAYLQAPITYDKKAVIEVLNQAEAGMAGQSTAIGDALGLGLKYLKDTPNKDKKVMILLTDGESNDGYFSVAQAIELAQKEGVKIYTIGLGSKNNFLDAIFGSQGFDEKYLKLIAEFTNGRYFKASSGADLARVYQEINALEPIDSQNKTIIKVTELFYIPACFALLLASIFLFVYKRRL